MPFVPKTFLVLAWLALVAAFLGRYHWLCDLASHAMFQYWLGTLVVSFWFLILRNWKWFTASSLTVLLLSFIILPICLGSNVGAASADNGDNSKPIKLRVVTCNVLTANRQKAKTIAFLRDSKADIILLIEVDEAWVTAINELHDVYPYRHGRSSQDNFGIMLLSKIPLKDESIQQFDDSQVDTVVATLNIDSRRSLRIIGTHPLPPISQYNSRYRNQHLDKLAIFVKEKSVPTLVMGDLNCTGWSCYFKDFLNKSGLNDSRQGQGIQPSWPAGTKFSWLRIPIEHILTTSDIATIERHVGPDIGSDHLPIVADLLW